MAIHSNSMLSSAFSSSAGFGVSATIKEPSEDAYSKDVILKHDVETLDESGLVVKENTVEIRKADCANSESLPRGTIVTIDSVDYYIGELLRQTTYTLIYSTTK